MKSETVKPIPASAAMPTTAAAAIDAPGEQAEPEADCEQGGGGDPDELAHHMAQDPIGQRGAHAVAGVERVPADHDAGVGEREDRQDQKARPRVKQPLQPLVRARSPSGFRASLPAPGRRWVARETRGTAPSRARGWSAAAG